MDHSFDDIRPYYEEEIPAAMQRIAVSDAFPLLASYVFPDHPVEEIRQMVSSIRTIEEFQGRVMQVFNDQVIRRSTTEFTFDGLQHIEHGVPYLYVSNHRDIVLDSSLLQNVLLKNGFGTTEITFGANLMCSQLIIDIGKSNKMFRVARGGTPKEFYALSKHLSDYIRHVICDKQQSVWIAQRNGRTKNGDDKTDQGIIKMFSLSNCGDKIESLSALHILPMSVSFEWEPCDILKTIELYISRSQKYIKRPGEDVTSVLSGILSPKGRVHYELCPAITKEDLLPLSECTLNEFHLRVARLLDQRIHAHYRLWPNNYIAHDMLYGQTTYRDRYTDEQRQAFMNRLNELDRATSLEQYGVTDRDALYEIFLGIYANPVNNSMNI